MKDSMSIQQTEKKRQTRMSSIVLLVLAILFVLLAFADAFNLIHSTDLKITDFVKTLKNPYLDNVTNFLSWFGELPQTLLIILLSSAALFIFRHRREGITLCVSSLSAIVLDELMKAVVRYPGPLAPPSPAPMNYIYYTFPSEHVIFYMAFFGFLFYLVASLIKHSWIRTALLILLGIPIVFIGVSRLYLLAHWTSDILGGYMFGGIALILTIRIYKHRRILNKAQKRLIGSDSEI